MTKELLLISALRDSNHKRKAVIDKLLEEIVKSNSKIAMLNFRISLLKRWLANFSNV